MRNVKQIIVAINNGLLERFILTMRNVKNSGKWYYLEPSSKFYINYEECKVVAGCRTKFGGQRFILTMRNVKTLKYGDPAYIYDGFILTMRGIFI